jgi:hypothetical protein
MKRFCVAAALVALIAGCGSTGSSTANQATRQDPAGTNAYVLSNTYDATPGSGNAASKPPRLSVGVGYPDTQLILPWFLNDIINFVNYR